MLQAMRARKLFLHVRIWAGVAHECNLNGYAAGCDALSVHLIITNLAGSLGMGLGWRATLFSVGVMGPWALAHWEEYHSGKPVSMSASPSMVRLCKHGRLNLQILQHCVHY